MAVKIPSYGPADSVNRGTFVPVPVQVASPPAGTDNAVVEFGYDPGFNCTSRQEACVAVSSAISETTPFYWTGESYTGQTCTLGCTVTIPALPQRVLYYRTKYRRTDGTVVATGSTQVTAVP
jgi:hypothetical protein